MPKLGGSKQIAFTKDGKIPPKHAGRSDPAFTSMLLAQLDKALTHRAQLKQSFAKQLSKATREVRKWQARVQEVRRRQARETGGRIELDNTAE